MAQINAQTKFLEDGVLQLENNFYLLTQHLLYTCRAKSIMAGMNWKLYLVSRVFIAIGLLLAPVFTLMMVVRRPFILLRRTKRRTSPPDCMLDPTLGKHQYVQANGIKFHYVTCGDPSKPLMLCLHGFPEVRRRCNTKDLICTKDH